VRQARKDAKPEKPGEAQRHGRAYRDIFQLVREALLSRQESTRSASPATAPGAGSDDALDEGYEHEDYDDGDED
jgi:ribosome-associated protein